MATINPGILGALDAAESFITGFEGDEMQEGIPELLAAIREAREAHAATMAALKAIAKIGREDYGPAAASRMDEIARAAIAKVEGRVNG